MACFIVPAAEALVATAATKITEKKEQKENPADLIGGSFWPRSRKNAFF